MLNEQILFALNDIDKLEIEEVGAALGYLKEKRRSKKLVRTVVLVAAVISLFAASAYAVNTLGIRDLFNTVHRELPAEAVADIQKEDAAVHGDGWSVRLTESLYDGTNAMVTLDFSCDERYILVPQDATPNDPVSHIGLESGGTLGNYAASKGKTLLMVGAALRFVEGGIVSQGVHSENLSDDLMAVIIDCTKDAPTSPEATCILTAVVDGTEEAQRLSLPVRFTESAEHEIMQYLPVDEVYISGLTIRSVSVEKTALGLNVHAEIDVADEAASRNVLRFDFAGLSFPKGGSWGPDADGNWTLDYPMGVGEPSDTLTVTVVDWDKQSLGEITLKLQ